MCTVARTTWVAMSDNQKQRVDSATCDVVRDVIHGNVDAVRKWLHGNGRQNIDKQALVLYRAAEEGHTDIFQLVNNCNTVPTDDLTNSLHLACCYGRLSVVQLIVSTHGHHCSSQLLDGYLLVATLHCHTKVVNWLLPLTHPTHADYRRWNLVLASARGDFKRVKKLVNKIGCDVTDVITYALWTACYWGRVDIVNWLMTHTSADVNFSRIQHLGVGNMMSLAIACHEGHMTVAKRLLIRTKTLCDVNIVTNTERNTALHEVINFTRETSLHQSCSRGDTAAVVDVVYESDVNMQNRAGWTAVYWAFAYGHLDIMKVLLSVFADTNITDNAGYTSVEAGVYGGSWELILAYYKRFNHLMSVFDEDDNNSNITVSGQVDHNNTDTQQITLENSVLVQSVENNNENRTNEVNNSNSNNRMQAS
jgi:ankyrin repeat protein